MKHTLLLSFLIPITVDQCSSKIIYYPLDLLIIYMMDFKAFIYVLIYKVRYIIYIEKIIKQLNINKQVSEESRRNL